MSAFDYPPPNFSDEILAKIALEHFGIKGAFKRLDSERDQNARLRSEKGDFVLKIANAGEDISFLNLQNAALLHIAAADPDLGVPKLVQTRTGAHSVLCQGADGFHQVRLLTYLKGRPLAKSGEAYPELLESLGAFMGRLTRALQSFDHPAARRPDFLWALDNAAACRRFVADIVDSENRHRVKRCFEDYDRRVAPRLPFLRSGVNHQDANDYNILVNEADVTRITGLIDFGDMCHGRQINELAVTLAYALMNAPDPLSAATAVIRGYAGFMPLQDDELEILYDLVAMRLVMSVCISSHRSKLHPENKYLLISQASAFELLRKLEALDTQYARALFREAAFAATSPEEKSESSPSQLLERRTKFLNPALSVSYRKKLKIVRGRGPYLYDDQGARYLDCVNNIAHVGHCHPHVVAALARQASLLNTNSRYLHDTIVDFAERIVATLPGDLSVVTFVNSGTEANELALRMARTATGRKETIVLDWAYHGNSSAAVEISPYKFKRAGGFPKPEFVEIAEFPDPYRGPHRGMGEATGRAYARSVADCVDRIQARTGRGPACFIAESISGVGGQVIYPQGYFKAAYAAVRAAGGLCIADEVQCGFARTGAAFWAFEIQDVIPDIVVLGKPIGAGHPLAAVITTPEIARAFAYGMEYFNSFGGNPVSMAVGMAVMDVLEEERLADNARAVGNYVLDRFREMATRYELIGDARGVGFFLGLELVRNQRTLEPATQEAGEIVNALRDKGILLSTDGPFDNVLKFKPPMVFQRRDAEFFCDALDAELAHRTI